MSLGSRAALGCMSSEHHPAVRWKSRSAKSGGAPSQSKFSRLTKKQHGPVGGPPNHASRMPKATGGTATKGSHVFKPVAIDQEMEGPGTRMNFGREITGVDLKRSEVLRLLNLWSSKPSVKTLASSHGLGDDYLFRQAFVSFRKFCMDPSALPDDLYVLISDILAGSDERHIDDIFPYFLTHARKVFPHLECMEDLRMISDLSDPTNWYPEARSIQRKVIFHSGPTNSGKTYHALERFFSSKGPAVYCGPLKLLAVEVANKSNDRGTPCDLVTGEERKRAREDGEPSEHVSCTVEMTDVTKRYEVAVIDEIQMCKDPQRGWAWTRALLGVPADEIHVCGEAAAVNLVQELLIHSGEELEVKTYNRLTKLVKETKAVESLSNIQPGDCIVCFNKQDIYSVSRGLETLGVECAVIYGSLPPGTKLAMAARFNDPDDSCKVLVATDAIGMGLNLNIRRLVFYSLQKLTMDPDNPSEKSMDVISVSQALQIAGRAGRFNTQWETGYVTCYHEEDMELMHSLLSQTPPEILQAGLHPTFDQIEMYAYHLPHAGLSNLIDIFVSLSKLNDDLYSLNNLDDFKFLAEVIEHIPLTLRTRYQFCCAPINRRMPLVCTMFLKIARRFSRGELLTYDWLCHQIGFHDVSVPLSILDLIHMEAVHDVFDLYLWLSYRFPDMFPDVEIVRSIQTELDSVIQEGVANIVQLLRNAETGSGTASTSDTQVKGAASVKLKNNVTGEDKGFHIPRVSVSEIAEATVASSSNEVVRHTGKRGGHSRTSAAPSSLTNKLVDEGLITRENLNKMMKGQNSID